MDTRELSRIDLNLLISLQVLLEERNVSRAAERLFITQPAMSKTLSRLRQVFDDPLFTRSSHGMQPTPRALEVAGDLSVILAEIGRLVREVDGPVNVVMGLVGAAPTVQELAALGVKRISIGGSLARASYAVVRRAAAEMIGPGTFSYAADAIPDVEMSAFMAGWESGER